MEILLRVFDLAHVEMANAADGILLVYDCGGLPLCLGKNNVNKVLKQKNMYRMLMRLEWNDSF